MARRRIIDPDFWIDDTIAKLDYKTMLLYIGLWNLADSNGVVENNEEKIRVQIFPYKKTSVVKSLETLVGLKKLIPYEVDKKKYFVIKNFKKWQKESHPAYKYPPPPTKEENLPQEQRNWKPPNK